MMDAKMMAMMEEMRGHMNEMAKMMDMMETEGMGGGKGKIAEMEGDKMTRMKGAEMMKEKKK